MPPAGGQVDALALDTKRLRQGQQARYQCFEASRLRQYGFERTIDPRFAQLGWRGHRVLGFHAHRAQRVTNLVRKPRGNTSKGGEPFRLRKLGSQLDGLALPPGDDPPEPRAGNDDERQQQADREHQDIERFRGKQRYAHQRPGDQPAIAGFHRTGGERDGFTQAGTDVGHEARSVLRALRHGGNAVEFGAGWISLDAGAIVGRKRIRDHARAFAPEAALHAGLVAQCEIENGLRRGGSQDIGGTGRCGRLAVKARGARLQCLATGRRDVPRMRDLATRALAAQ